MNGLYNGLSVHSHRARIPSMCAVEISSTSTRITKSSYSLDIEKGGCYIYMFYQLFPIRIYVSYSFLFVILCSNNLFARYFFIKTLCCHALNSDLFSRNIF